MCLVFSAWASVGMPECTRGEEGRMDTRVADHAESLVLRKQADRPGARGMVPWAMG